MVVLTVELRGMGIVQHVGDVAANPSSGLPQGPPRFQALLGHHHVNGESREGEVLVLTSELGGMGIVQTVSDVAAHPSSGLPRVPPSGSRHCAAILRHRLVGCRQCHSAVGVVGCRSGWLVVVVRKLVMPHHAVCICKNVTCCIQQHHVTSRATAASTKR